MSLKTRIKALEAKRKADKAIPPRQSWRATVAEMDAELDAVCAKLDLAIAEDAERRALIGETAWAAVVAERERLHEISEWNTLHGRPAERTDLIENREIYESMMLDLAESWKQDHIEAGTWPAVVERMTRLDAERAHSNDQ